ncbi:MAG: polysaccharide deacetylase family protein, partial [Alphaproteobacteria bacterium]
MAPTRIVNFHGIGAPARTLEEGEPPYWISVEQYRRILDQAVAIEAAGGARFVFTFDDGNKSDIEIGAAELDARGLKGAFFPLAGRLDAPGSLSRADVRALADAGHKVGTHGRDHVSWLDLDAAAEQAEMVDARAALAEAAGAKIDMAAIPLGQYGRRTLAQLKAHGYRTVYTSDGGEADPAAWLQPRRSVRGDMSDAD